MDKALDFLKLLRQGGVIVSTNDLSSEQIAVARNHNRLFVDESGFGYVFCLPIQEVKHG